MIKPQDAAADCASAILDLVHEQAGRHEVPDESTAAFYILSQLLSLAMTVVALRRAAGLPEPDVNEVVARLHEAIKEYGPNAEDAGRAEAEGPRAEGSSKN